MQYQKEQGSFETRQLSLRKFPHKIYTTTNHQNSQPKRLQQIQNSQKILPKVSYNSPINQTKNLNQINSNQNQIIIENRINRQIKNNFQQDNNRQEDIKRQEYYMNGAFSNKNLQNINQKLNRSKEILQNSLIKTKQPITNLIENYQKKIDQNIIYVDNNQKFDINYYSQKASFVKELNKKIQQNDSNSFKQQNIFKNNQQTNEIQSKQIKIQALLNNLDDTQATQHKNEINEMKKQMIKKNLTNLQIPQNYLSQINSKKCSLAQLKQVNTEKQEVKLKLDPKDIQDSFKQFDFIIKKRQQTQKLKEPQKEASFVKPVQQTFDPPKNIETNIISNKHPIFKEDDLLNFEIGKVLGLGSYAIVKYAVHKSSGLEVAIKSYIKSKLVDPMKKKSVEREVQILQNLQHVNIIKIYNVIDTQHSLHLIMEYVPFISLSDYMKSKNGKTLDEQQGRFIIKQIASALSYCHRRHVVHRDIKMENVLISKDFHVKIIDFGFAVALQPGQTINIFCGTPTYMAPEIINKQDYNCSVDVWALGALTYKILSQEYPFRGLQIFLNQLGKSDKDLYRKINNCSVNFPHNFSQELRRFIMKIIRFNPQERITADQILIDEWIVGQ